MQNCGKTNLDNDHLNTTFESQDKSVNEMNIKSDTRDVTCLSNVNDETVNSTKLAMRSSGVFFRHESVNFGLVQLGSLTRLKLELCNATDDEVYMF